MFNLGLEKGATVVDFGAGSGFFALAAAKASGNTGKVYVVDVMETALEHVSSVARLNKLTNIKTIRHDLDSDAVSEIPTGCADLVIVANLIHQLKHHQNLLSEIYRVLKTNGQALVIDWNAKPSPIGPKASARVTDEKIKNIFGDIKLKFEQEIETDTYHFGLIFTK